MDHNANVVVVKCFDIENILETHKPHCPLFSLMTTNDSPFSVP